jgi:SAM-dependent methyltransferase
MFRYPLQVHGAMPLKILKEYFHTGAEAADYIYGFAPKAKKILDFGCGYGRVSRFLKVRFPEAELLVSDPKKSAMDFQIENLKTIADDHSPVNLIFAGSVFTHLPKKLFQNSLHELMTRLIKGGALILTLHQFIDNEFSIYPFTEEAALTGLEDPIDSAVYGSVYCSKEFFEFCIYSHTEGNLFKCSIDDSSSFGGTQQYIVIERLNR